MKSKAIFFLFLLILVSQSKASIAQETECVIYLDTKDCINCLAGLKKSVPKLLALFPTTIVFDRKYSEDERNRLASSYFEASIVRNLKITSCDSSYTRFCGSPNSKVFLVQDTFILKDFPASDLYAHLPAIIEVSNRKIVYDTIKLTGFEPDPSYKEIKQTSDSVLLLSDYNNISTYFINIQSGKTTSWLNDSSITLIDLFTAYFSDTLGMSSYLRHYRELSKSFQLPLYQLDAFTIEDSVIYGLVFWKFPYIREYKGSPATFWGEKYFVLKATLSEAMAGKNPQLLPVRDSKMDKDMYFDGMFVIPVGNREYITAIGCDELKRRKNPFIGRLEVSGKNTLEFVKVSRPYLPEFYFANGLEYEYTSLLRVGKDLVCHPYAGVVTDLVSGEQFAPKYFEPITRYNKQGNIEFKRRLECLSPKANGGYAGCLIENDVIFAFETDEDFVMKSEQPLPDIKRTSLRSNIIYVNESLYMLISDGRLTSIRFHSD